MKKALALILSAAAVMCLFTSCGSTEEETTATAETSAEAVSETIQTSETVAIKDGEYQDETSQRAVADVTIIEDKYEISVNWGNSATETVNWSMTCTLDGNRLTYTDCRKSVISTDEKNPSSAEEYENGTGYFTVENGRLLWDGAAEADCRECVFAQ